MCAKTLSCLNRKHSEIKQVQENPHETRRNPDGPDSFSVGLSSGMVKLPTSEHEKAALYKKSGLWNMEVNVLCV